METNPDDAEVLETQQTDEQQDTNAQVYEATEEPQPDERDAKIAQLEAEKAELEGKNKQLYERAKKAAAPKAPSQDNLSNKDIIYLAKADIHADDLDEVVELARLKKWDVSKAHDYLKPVLETRAEERKSANATQVRSPRGTSKTSGNELLERARRGAEIPDTDEAFAEVFKARRARLIPDRK